MTFRPGDLYHSGYLVENIEECLSRLNPIGIDCWTPPKDYELQIQVGDERSTARFRYVYSAVGPHHIELIEPVEDGYLRATGPMSFHHLGFWVDDLPASVEQSKQHGLTLECTFLNDDGTAKVTYHRDAAGMRYEMVPRSHQPILEERWARARAGMTAPERIASRPA